MTTTLVSAGTLDGVSDHFLTHFVEFRESRYERIGWGRVGNLPYGRNMGNVLAR